MLLDLPKHEMFQHSWGLLKLVYPNLFFLSHEPKPLQKLASPIREKMAKTSLTGTKPRYDETQKIKKNLVGHGTDRTHISAKMARLAKS